MGTVRISKNGTSGPYLVVKVYGHTLFREGERVYLHQYVLCNKIGRRLKKSEHSHHKDGDKRNNKPSNLEVVDKSKHISQHLKEWYAQATKEQKKVRGTSISRAKKGKPQPWARENGMKLIGTKRSEEFKSKVSKGMKRYCADLPDGEMARRFKK